MSHHDLSRREALKLTGLGLAAAALGPGVPGLRAAPARPERKRVLRVAHLTDIHVEPELRTADGMAACLRHVNALADKPDLILTGGDHVFDSFEQTEARTRTQWELFSKVLKDENRIPLLSCVGNHDCWGWNKAKSKATGDEPNYGKKWALDLLSMAQRYYSADRAGWHIIALDSIFPSGNGYIGRIDDEQFEWLRGDLAAVKPQTPILILSHIPIFSVAVLEFGDKDDRPKNEVDPGLMHIDAGRLHKLFLAHSRSAGPGGGVRACISGHLHLIDRCDYDGVSYLCNGAVSGNWWKGRHQECDEGYALLNLYDDGTFEREYATYGWKAEKPKK